MQLLSLVKFILLTEMFKCDNSYLRLLKGFICLITAFNLVWFVLCLDVLLTLKITIDYHKMLQSLQVKCYKLKAWWTDIIVRVHWLQI